MKKDNKSRILRLEINELCNERKPPPDISFPFPELKDEEIDSLLPEEKMKRISEFLELQKTGYKQFKALEQREIEKEFKREMFLLKYNTFDGFPKHQRFFQKQIHCQETFSGLPYKSNGFKTRKTRGELSKENENKRLPWNYITKTSNFFDEKSCYKATNPMNNSNSRKLESLENYRKNRWENFTHPKDSFEKRDIDEWDFKIKRIVKKTGIFEPNSKTGVFFDKTLKDYH